VTAGSKIKVEMVGNSRGHKNGEIVAVDKAVAERLIRNGHALSITEAGKRLEREIRES
jgi:hypothetical protein